MRVRNLVLALAISFFTVAGFASQTGKSVTGKVKSIDPSGITVEQGGTDVRYESGRLAKPLPEALAPGETVIVTQVDGAKHVTVRRKKRQEAGRVGRDNGVDAHGTIDDRAFYSAETEKSSPRPEMPETRAS